MTRLAVILAALALTCGAASAYQAVSTVEGVARIVDGDGLRLGGVEVRLQGIAAPELRQRGGREAARALKALAAGKPVTCYLDGTTTYDRVVGRCTVGGQDVGAVLVFGGWARDCPRYSRGDYAPYEAAARAAGRDLSRTYRLPGYCRP